MTFHKYPKIKILGHEDNEDILANPEDEIVIEEKIDGANFRFMLKEGRIIFGSRTQSIGDDQKEIGGNWKRCVEFIKSKHAEDTTHFFESYIYYGECCVKHTMAYNWETMPPFLGFDIYDLKEEKFIDCLEKEDVFADAGLPEVPHIKIVKAKDIKELTDADVPESKYYAISTEDKQAEGIVLKNYKTQTMAKYVREKFKEANRETFGGGKKYAENDDERIVAMFCTNARIDKCTFKLLDEGFKIEMPLMATLPKKVIEDIYEEHWNEICMSSWSVNFKNIRKKVTARCLAVLKQMIVNNSLN